MALIPSLVAVLGVLTLTWVGVLWLRDRERELREGLRPELLGKLKRRPADAATLLDELRASGRVSVPRVVRSLRELEASGLIRGSWQDDPDGRPRRVYAAVAADEAVEAALPEVVVERK